MELTSIMRPENMTLNLKATDRLGVIKEMIDMLYASDAISDKEEILKAVLQREEGDRAQLRRRQQDGSVVTVEYGRYPYAVLDSSMRGLPNFLFFVCEENMGKESSPYKIEQLIEFSKWFTLMVI